MRWVFGRNSALEEQVRQLRSELAAYQQEHERNRAEWREECERLHGVISQQGENIQALAQRGSADGPIHTYLSQFAALGLGALGGGTAIANFFTVDDSTAQLVIFVLNGVGVLALLIASQLFKRRRALREKGQEDLRMDAMSAGLYLLGVICFVTGTILLAMN